MKHGLEQFASRSLRWLSDPLVYAIIAGAWAYAGCSSSDPATDPSADAADDLRRHCLHEVCRDAGTPTPDAGPSAPDAGSVQDAAAPPPDGSSTNRDASAPDDGSTSADASTPPPACTKYVSSSGSLNGHQAFTTIQAGVSTLQPGDVLCVAAGTYAEKIAVNASGTSSSPITIAAYPGASPIIDGTRVSTYDWEGLVSIYGTYVNVAGFEVKNSAGRGVWLKGTHNKASRMNVHHSIENGILIGGDYGVVEDSLVWQNCQSNGKGTTTPSTGTWASGLSAARESSDGITDFAVIRRNTVYENWGEGLSTFEANGTIIEDNTVYDNWATNTYISDASNVIFRNNLVYNPSNSVMVNKWSQATFTLADEVSSRPRSAKNIVINNTFLGGPVDLFSWTIVSGSGLDRVIFANNTIVNARLGTGAINTGSLIQNNIVFRNDGGPLASVPSRSGLTFLDNLWSPAAPQNASGSGDVVGNPLLALSGSIQGGQLTRNYFAISASSPAKGRGGAISATTDYVHVTSQGTLDIGAYVNAAIPVQYQ